MNSSQSVFVDRMHFLQFIVMPFSVAVGIIGLTVGEKCWSDLGGKSVDFLLGMLMAVALLVLVYGSYHGIAAQCMGRSSSMKMSS